MNDQFFTVSELNTLIRDILASGFPQPVWICGEIQGFRVDQKGHAYFELCENEEESHNVKAKIRVSLWNTRRTFIESVLKRAENAFSLKDGIQVKFLCKVDFWTKGGSLSLTVENIDPAYTLGKIAQERQKLIALLKKDGVLDKNKQLEFSPVILNIGLITSFDSAAYNDFIHELKLSGFGFKVFLANAIMQGKTSEGTVVAALKTLNSLENLDAIVITRGGGSIAELSCFDSEPIARAIAASPLPVITGIGHEINTTVTDLAAHTFAKTPTAVAQFLVGRISDFLQQLDQRKERIFDLAQDGISSEKDALRTRAVSLQTETMAFLRDHRERVLKISESFKRVPTSIIKEASKNLTVQRQALVKTIQLNLTNAATRINNYQKLIGLASPVNTLKRGFSITRGKNGAALKGVRQAKKGERVTTELADGTFTSEVI